MITVDEARERLSDRLKELFEAEHTYDAELIKAAQKAVERAEDVLCEVTLRDEGGWKGGAG